MPGIRFACLAFLVSLPWSARGAELTPQRVSPFGLARYGDRTISVALQVDRERAELVAYTVKDRPFEQALQVAAPRPSGDRGVQVEVALVGPGGVRLTERRDVAGLCFEHGAGEPAHVEGDRVRVHRESLVVEVPEVAGFDHVEIAYHVTGSSGLVRISIGVLPLDAAHFTAAGGSSRYEELAFAGGLRGDGASARTPGTVHWPEEYGDPDLTTIYGNGSEVPKRVNIVIVPDGYTYAEKATMQSHAQAMVNWFRGKTPYAEHDPFLNYILVYAYSTESGTDQCDCAIVKDTAMATRFPDLGYPCGDSNQRCLYYGTGNGGTNCDPNTSTANIAAAELRAPADDFTIIMVNTSRYGGCGGARAVYSAGNGSAVEVAVHELGHTFPNLADEYAYTSGCGTYAGEINTSLDGTNGAWPEWIADVGAPRQGAEYYQSCIYRPEPTCDMQQLNVPFCRICDQRWALEYFGHYRVNPTAPIESQTPASPVNVPINVPTPFSVTTRLPTGAGVTNAITWKIQGPGYPVPTVVATDVTSYTHTFNPAGQYTLTCEVIADTNFVKPAKNGANVDTATWIVNAGTSCGTIVLSPATLPNGTFGVAYSQTITASGGTAPYTFAVTAGALPPGLALASGGVLSGVPSAAGTYLFTVTATDAAACAGSLGYTLVITASCNLTIAPPSLPGGTVGVPYSQTITVSGGAAPYTLNVTGTIPPGLSFSGTNPFVLSGTPTTTGTYAFTLDASDAAGCTVSQPYSITVNPAGCGSILLTPATLAAAVVGVAYSQTISASGGAPPYAFAVSAGSPPSGLTLSSAGVLSGTPSLSGGYTFTVTATDSAGCMGNRAYTLALGQDFLAGLGLGQPNPNRVRVFTAAGAPAATDFLAYAAGQYGVNVAAADVDGGVLMEILAGPGPGPQYGPQVRGFRNTGMPIGKINFYAYGTLRYGVNVASGDVDGDAYAEIASGAGPGPVFGPHVRGWNFDGVAIAPLPNFSFFAYATLRYGANVALGDIDGDAYAEVLTGAGPGQIFGTQVRAFDYDGLRISATKVNFNAYTLAGYGVNVASDDVDFDAFAEIATAPGPGPTHPARFLGFDYDAASIAPLAGFDVTAFPTSYGGRVGLGDSGSDGPADLVAGAGRDASANATVKAYTYTGSSLVLQPGSFDPFPGATYGVNATGGDLGF
ncbi:MAG: putative Ig domain-containing protein [Acidobacteriota bacterium]